MVLTMRLLLPFQFGLFPLAIATVFLNRAQDGISSCKGTMTVITCTTTTDTGFLSWRNSKGMSFIFNTASSTGANGTLGSTIMSLNSIETVSNAVVYISTAFEQKITETTTKQCSDGGSTPQSIDIYIKSPSSPSWAYSACRFSQDSVQLSWNTPSVASECCSHYAVSISTGSVFNTSETNATVPIGKEAVTATVYCVDHIGEMVTKTEDMTINTNIAITQVTIEPVDNSCDANTTYQISWATNTSSQDVCTPPITNWTVTCTTSSTNQSSNSSTQCSVPAIETINVTVTIINAAGFNASKSASADLLAQSCQMLRLCNTSSVPCDQLPPAGIVENVMENTQCSDKGPSSPSWAYSACSFSQGSVQLSWNAPSVAPECCVQYIVQLSTRSVNTTETSVTVPIGNETTANVHCVDEGGEMVTKTEILTINTNIAIEHITIEPVKSSCDANTTYQISWTTDISSQDMCAPPITKSIITCATPSTHQSSNSTRCSVPANETINVTVTIIDAVGFTTSKSTSADILAQACQMLNSALPRSTSLSVELTDQLSSAEVAAIMGSGLLILAIVCIALVVYIVWSRPKLKETYKLNAVADTSNKNLPKEKEAEV